MPHPCHAYAAVACAMIVQCSGNSKMQGATGSEDQVVRLAGPQARADALPDFGALASKVAQPPQDAARPNALAVSVRVLQSPSESERRARAHGQSAPGRARHPTPNECALTRATIQAHTLTESHLQRGGAHARERAEPAAAAAAAAAIHVGAASVAGGGGPDHNSGVRRMPGGAAAAAAAHCCATAVPLGGVFGGGDIEGRRWSRPLRVEGLMTKV